MTSDPRPIGVFDSGVGGLTVLRTLQSRLPSESFLYLGDTARLPYGSKSGSTIRKYAEQNIAFLAALDVKAVVIACNSASTQMMESSFAGLPVYNVIKPGAKAALAVSSRKRIGVIGTRATVLSGAYETELKYLSADVSVISRACPLLVPLAEEGWDNDPVTNLIVYRYLQAIMAEQIDTLILGCTHYPILEGSISRVTGSSVALVESGDAIAAAMIEDASLGVWHRAPASVKGTLRLMMTDDSGVFRELSKKLLGFVPPPEVVNL